ncbi:hypothetical protein [Duganella hordei]|uniref:hypothetical protein n=1 Tax=Duganella hordei TaxID=2865934 RepID=UPI0030E99712
MQTETVATTYKKAERACLAAVALLVLYLLWEVFSSPFSGADFDEKRWADAAGHDDTCIRGAMVNDLLKKRVQIGMSRSSLVAIVGKPDHGDGMEISYYLGFCQTPVDPDTLDFYFDSRGALTRHEIRNH